MRTQQLIDKIRFNPLFTDLDNLFRLDKETFEKKRLNTYILKYWDQKEMVFYHRTNTIIKQLPSISKKFTFKYANVNVTAYIYIGINEYSRRKAEIKTKLHFYCPEAYRLFSDIETMEVPLSFNLDHPEKQLRKILSKFIIPEGYFSELQIAHQCNIKDVHRYYKPLMNYKKPLDYNLTDIACWMKRHFNVEPNGYIYEAIELINKNGKYKYPVCLGAMDRSFANDIDGDIDELEEAFWEEMEQYPKNMIFVN